MELCQVEEKITIQISNGDGVAVGNGTSKGVGHGIGQVGNGVGNGVHGVGNGVHGVGNGVEKKVIGNGVGNGVSRRERQPREKDEATRALEELRLSTIRGNLEGVRRALAKGVSVNQTLQGGWSPLMYACSMGHPNLVEALLQEGANPNFHKELFTPLMAACASTRENEEKLVHCVDLLLAAGVDVNAVERHRISALMFAAKEGHEKLVRRLLKGAGYPGCNVNLQDSQGWTALFWGVNQGRTLVVATLVQAGAKVHIKDRRGQTAFDLAVGKGLSEIASILSTQHLSREPPDSLLDPLLDPSVNCADPALSASLAALPNGKRSDERHGCEAELEILLNGMALPERLLSPPESLRWSRSRSASSCSGFGPGRSRSRSPLGDLSCFDHTDGGIALSRNARKMIRNVRRYRARHGQRHHSISLCSRNETYSLQDAVVVLSCTVRHLSVLFASVSYVRLRLQGRPVDLPLDKRYAGANGLAALSARALRQAELLRAEVQFLQQFTEKLDETDTIVPADVIVERKDGIPTYTLTSVLIITAATAVFVYKLKNGPPSLVWWWW